MKRFSAEEVYAAADCDVIGREQIDIFGGKIGPNGGTGENIDLALRFLKSVGNANNQKGLVALCANIVMKPMTVLTLGITKNGKKGDKRGWSASAFAALPQIMDTVRSDDPESVRAAEKTIDTRLRNMRAISNREQLQVDESVLLAYANVNMTRCKIIFFYALTHDKGKYDSATLSSARQVIMPDGSIPSKTKGEDESITIMRENFQKFEKSVRAWRASKDSRADSADERSSAKAIISDAPILSLAQNISESSSVTKDSVSTVIPKAKGNK